MSHQQRKVWLAAHTENHGRWGAISGFVKGGVYRVNILVMSHDERWYVQKPALTAATPNPHLRAFATDVAFGLDVISNLGREYVVVACIAPEDLPTNGVYEDLNSLPAGCVLSAPLSVVRTDTVVAGPVV